MPFRPISAELKLTCYINCLLAYLIYLLTNLNTEYLSSLSSAARVIYPLAHSARQGPTSGTTPSPPPFPTFLFSTQVSPSFISPFIFPIPFVSHPNPVKVSGEHGTSSPSSPTPGHQGRSAPGHKRILCSQNDGIVLRHSRLTHVRCNDNNVVNLK